MRHDSMDSIWSQVRECLWTRQLPKMTIKSIEDMDFNVDFMMMQCRAKLNLAREDGRDQARCE
jgi:hypothetical protein